MSIERVVAILTPLFAAFSGWLTGWIGSNLPGLPAIPATDVTALQIAGFTAATAAALKWLHGRAQFVQAENAAKRDVTLAEKKVEAVVAANPPAGPAIGDIENLLKTHEASIEQSIESHVPTVVSQALAALFSQFTPAQPVPVASNPPVPPTAQ